uniref:Mammalian cell entry protein n=1 Tax=Haemonchus placei TaxID=6290 RepID=A0A0N4WXA3_HAEPC
LTDPEIRADLYNSTVLPALSYAALSDVFGGSTGSLNIEFDFVDIHRKSFPRDLVQ